MKQAYFILLLAITIGSCKKDIKQEIQATPTHNEIIITEEHMQPPVHLLMQPSEMPLPERPYMLVEYTNTRRAYENIPQSNSYTYSYVRTVQTKEAVYTYTPPYEIIVDFDTYQQKPGIDVAKMLDCFQMISDIGAICSIELFTDIPVDGKPDLFFNWDNQSPGHTFVQLKKSNLGKTMVMNVGLYPVESWRTIYNTGYIAGKYVNDSQHEFNASMKMSLTPQQLAVVISTMRLVCKTSRYDIDDYNCTDFAVKIFNSVRSNDPIIVPKYRIPGSFNTAGSSTPQGLYKELLKRFNISTTNRMFFAFPQSKSYVEQTKTACK